MCAVGSFSSTQLLSHFYRLHAKCEQREGQGERVRERERKIVCVK